MALSDWQVSAEAQPKPEEYDFDLDQALSAVVSVRATVPDDAFTAEVLGTERSGTGVLIRRDGLVLTVGYLITEAETVWLGLNDGRTIQGHVLGFDQETGFGLVQALARLDLPALPIGRSGAAELGSRVVIGGAGGRTHSTAARIVGRQEFAGYWEYVLDEALFTAPAHPYWGGTAVIGPSGELIGVGSLQLEQARSSGQSEHLNMVIPIDLLKPVLDDLMTLGRPNRPPRPWLGLYATEVEKQVAIVGVAENGPAEMADLQRGDVVLAVAGTKVDDLAGFFRRIWSLGNAGVKVPLTISRDDETLEIEVTSGDRNAFLKRPKLH